MAPQIDAQRGLREATIISANAATHVKAGRQVEVRLRLQLYRARQRTISFKLRIPGDARGRLVAKLQSAGSTAGGAGAGSALVSLLTSALSGGGLFGGGPSPPASIPALRKAFARVGTYDGLVVGFGSRKRQHAYRDAKLVINGSAKLIFRVRR